MNKKKLNITDEELDQLFRDATNRFQPPDAPEGAWDRFYKTKMLYPHKNAEKQNWYATLGSLLGRFLIPGRSWQFATTAMLIIIAGVLLFYEKNASTGARSKEKELQHIAKNNTMAPETTPKAPAIFDSIAEGGNRYIPGIPVERQPLINSLSTPPNPLPVAGNMPAPFILSDKPMLFPGIRHRDSTETNKRFYSLRLKPQEQPVKPALPGYYSLSQTEITTAKNTTPSQWQLGVIAGSNLGMIRGDVSKKPGVNAGLLVQKKLGLSRFSVESGVVYESMTYDVNNADFNPNGQPVSSKVSNIEGACTMIDVPVNVRYDVVSSKKNKAFVSTGVSPTMIVKQSYIYDYDQGEGPVQVNRDVSGKGKSVYAVANLSIGYEQKWNHISVQIAPYVKIPMGEIGYGNLSLGGIGTQISIKKDL